MDHSDNGMDVNSFKYLLDKISKIDEKLDSINIKVDDLNVYTKVEVAKLNMKAGVWGGLSGLMTAIAAILIWMASRGG